jgi:arylsulfatase A-like enzyme
MKPSRRRGSRLVVCILLAGGACSARDEASPLRAEGSVLHLEDHLAAADVEATAPALAGLRNLSWHFWEDGGNATAGGNAGGADGATAPRAATDGDETPAAGTDPAAAWRPLAMPFPGGNGASALDRTAETLRLSVHVYEGSPFGPIAFGGLTVRLDDVDTDDYESILITARTTDTFMGMLPFAAVQDATLAPEALAELPDIPELPPVFGDGQEHAYVLPLPRATPAETPGEAPVHKPGELALAFLGAASGSAIDILSIELVPVGAAHAEAYGLGTETRGHAIRRTLYAHTPARLAYDVVVPQGGRLDFGLGVARANLSVDFRVRVTDGGEETLLFEGSHADAETWAQQSVDLSALAGRTVTLALEADATSEGTLALWAAPTLSSATPADRPNVIFYVIDGGGADFMSVYGYNRRTTPFMEQLAEEGVVFERAHTNATWTQPSTASFMTSLQHSVLGGLNRGVHSTPVPPEATTMAEHLHGAGYQTASFTTNPNASRTIGMERGVDVLREAGPRELVSTSSVELHEDYWRFREEYPGTPYWAHFQTTDVHDPHQPVPPFAGLFVTPAERATFDAQTEELWSAGNFNITSVYAWYRSMFEAAGIDSHAYYETMRGLYDETMAHQDYRLRQLVTRLRDAGEWDNTLLIIASDHGHPAGTFARFGRGILDPQPPDWEGALFDSFNTRIPLIFVWSRGIEGGRRIAQPVSMIDVLPTILDLVGAPQPEVLQGQSLAPALRGEPGWQARPVILDEFRVDLESGAMIGNLEIIDGRWGASLEIRPIAEGEDPAMGRHVAPAGGRWGVGHEFFPDVPRLLLYDLSTDTFATRNVNDQYSELVAHYTELLEEQWAAHQALAQQFGSSEAAPLTPEQLRTLRALGYIR